MNDELRETWTTRELPILRAALREVDAGKLANLETIRQQLGLPGMEVLAAVRALEGADYVETSLTLGWSDTHASGHITRVGERARRELGTWPAADTLVEQLAAALDEAAERETEPERKRGLRTAAAVLGGVARDIAVHAFERKLGI